MKSSTFIPSGGERIAISHGLSDDGLFLLAVCLFRYKDQILVQFDQNKEIRVLDSTDSQLEICAVNQLDAVIEPVTRAELIETNLTTLEIFLQSETIEFANPLPLATAMVFFLWRDFYKYRLPLPTLHLIEEPHLFGLFEALVRKDATLLDNLESLTRISVSRLLHTSACKLFQTTDHETFHAEVFHNGALPTDDPGHHSDIFLKRVADFYQRYGVLVPVEDAPPIVIVSFNKYQQQWYGACAPISNTANIANCYRWFQQISHNHTEGKYMAELRIIDPDKCGSAPAALGRMIDNGVEASLKPITESVARTLLHSGSSLRRNHHGNFHPDRTP